MLIGYRVAWHSTRFFATQFESHQHSWRQVVVAPFQMMFFFHSFNSSLGLINYPFWVRSNKKDRRCKSKKKRLFSSRPLMIESIFFSPAQWQKTLSYEIATVSNLVRGIWIDEYSAIPYDQSIGFNEMFKSYHQQVARAHTFSLCKLMLWVMNLRANNGKKQNWSIRVIHSLNKLHSYLRDEKHLTMNETKSVECVSKRAYNTLSGNWPKTHSQPRLIFSSHRTIYLPFYELYATHFWLKKKQQRIALFYTPITWHTLFINCKSMIIVAKNTQTHTELLQPREWEKALCTSAQEGKMKCWC